MRFVVLGAGAIGGVAAARPHQNGYEVMVIARGRHLEAIRRQSLVRGTGAIETDYLNGEIALQGRLHGVPTPVNEALCRLAGRAARDGRPPGSVAAADVLAVGA